MTPAESPTAIVGAMIVGFVFCASIVIVVVALIQLRDWLDEVVEAKAQGARLAALTTDTLAYVLHGQPVEVGDWVTLDRPDMPRREGEFRGVNKNTRQIRVRLWSPTLGRMAKGNVYVAPEHVQSVTAALDPSQLTAGRLVRHRARYGVPVS